MEKIASKDRFISERKPSFGEPEDAEKHTEHQRHGSGTSGYSEVCCHSSVGIVRQNTEVPFTTHEYNFEVVIHTGFAKNKQKQQSNKHFCTND